MGLKIDEIATVGIVRAAKEMIEAHFEQVGRRRIAGNMPAEFTVGAIGPHDHGQRIPAQRGGKLFFDIEVSRIRRLLIDGDRIRVGRDIEARRCDTVGRRVGREPIEQVLSRSAPACRTTPSSASSHSAVSSGSSSIFVWPRERIEGVPVDKSVILQLRKSNASSVASAQRLRGMPQNVWSY
jgi:hypothetical protein